jgi:hypothetical protein
MVREWPKKNEALVWNKVSEGRGCRHVLPLRGKSAMHRRWRDVYAVVASGRCTCCPPRAEVYQLLRSRLRPADLEMWHQLQHQ